MPEKFDPLNETSGRDYRRTQQLARRLSVDRATDLLIARSDKVHIPDISGTKKGSPQWRAALKLKVGRVDRQLWSEWKGSSTSDDGKLLQVATADELGGRLNPKTAAAIDRPEVIQRANLYYGDIGGYNGVKAYVRAKWETSQYLLDKAGIHDLQLYRAVKLSPDVYEKLVAAWIMRHFAAREEVGSFSKLPTLHVDRNGAASTSTDPTVTNGWGGGVGSRVVLRASVPRTAVISVPAYGINVHSEHEVVVAGTAWKGWDAWANKAPTFDKVPMKQAA